MKTPPIITKQKVEPLESKVESYFKKEIRKIGGISYKFNSKNVRGVSDQIILFDGRVVFVEIKRASGKMTKLQHCFRSRIIQNKGECVTCYGHKGVDTFIKTLIGGEVLKSTIYDVCSDQMPELDFK